MPLRASFKCCAITTMASSDSVPVSGSESANAACGGTKNTAIASASGAAMGLEIHMKSPSPRQAGIHAPRRTAMKPLELVRDGRSARAEGEVRVVIDQGTANDVQRQAAALRCDEGQRGGGTRHRQQG